MKFLGGSRQNNVAALTLKRNCNNCLARYFCGLSCSFSFNKAKHVRKPRCKANSCPLTVYARYPAWARAKVTVICRGKICTGNSASRQLGSRARHCSESSLLIRLKTQLSAASSCRRRTTGVTVWERWNFRGRRKRDHNCTEGQL